MYGFMRLVSLIFVVIALMLMGGDLVSSLEIGGVITVRSVAVVWDLFQKGGAEAFLAWSGTKLPSFLVAVIAWLLSVWSWAIPGLIGVGLAFLFGRHHEEA